MRAMDNKEAHPDRMSAKQAVHDLTLALIYLPVLSSKEEKRQVFGKPKNSKPGKLMTGTL